MKPSGIATGLLTWLACTAPRGGRAKLRVAPDSLHRDASAGRHDRHPPVRDQRAAAGCVEAERCRRQPPRRRQQGAFPTFDVVTWFRVLTSAGTPPEIVSRLNGEIIRILRMPAVEERLAAQGIDIITSTPAQYLDYIKSARARWAQVVKVSGAKLG